MMQTTSPSGGADNFQEIWASTTTSPVCFTGVLQGHFLIKYGTVGIAMVQYFIGLILVLTIFPYGVGKPFCCAVEYSSPCRQLFQWEFLNNTVTYSSYSSLFVLLTLAEESVRRNIALHTYVHYLPCQIAWVTMLLFCMIFGLFNQEVALV